MVNLLNGFNPIKVLQTQTANAQHREVPGLNTTQGQIDAYNNTSGFKTGTSGGGGGGGGGNLTTDDTYVLGDSTNSPYKGGGTSGGTSTADAQAKAAALLQIDQGLNGANDALGRLDTQANTGYGNIQRDYQDAYNRLIGKQSIDERNYNQNRTGQVNEYLSARNNAAANARAYLDSARRQLGSSGAGGGSAARYGVPLEAQNQAAAGNAQAQSTNNRNLIALDQSWQDAKDQYGNSINDLGRQREQGTNDYKSKIEQQRADLLNTIGQLTGQKTIAGGGSYQQALAASQPYTSRISSILSTIDGLAATPAIREQNVTMSRPDLAGYNYARPESPVVAPQDPTLGGAPVIDPYATNNQDQRNPLLALFGLQDPNQRQFS